MLSGFVFPIFVYQAFPTVGLVPVVCVVVILVLILVVGGMIMIVLLLLRVVVVRVFRLVSRLMLLVI